MSYFMKTGGHQRCYQLAPPLWAKKMFKKKKKKEVNQTESFLCGRPCSAEMCLSLQGGQWAHPTNDKTFHPDKYHRQRS